MCTVTYLPLGGQSYILTSNRDEAPSRADHQIYGETRQGEQLLFPKDSEAGGTWIATSDTGRSLVILNGAFRPHKRQLPYRRSRGLMVKDYFDYPSSEAFIEQYEFVGIEPFTLVLVELGKLTELRWDGHIPHKRILDPNAAYVWASSTLYDEQAIHNRERWFKSWQESESSFSPDAIWSWHHSAGDGDSMNDVIMNRYDLVRTVSVTQIVQSNNQVTLRFDNLLELGSIPLIGRMALNRELIKHLPEMN